MPNSTIGPLGRPRGAAATGRLKGTPSLAVRIGRQFAGNRTDMSGPVTVLASGAPCDPLAPMGDDEPPGRPKAAARIASVTSAMAAMWASLRFPRARLPDSSRCRVGASGITVAASAAFSATAPFSASSRRRVGVPDVAGPQSGTSQVDMSGGRAAVVGGGSPAPRGASEGRSAASSRGADRRQRGPAT